LGHEKDAVPDRVLRAGDLQRCRFERDRPGNGWLDAEDRSSHFRSSRPDETGHSKNLAPSNTKRNFMVRVPPCAQSVDPEVIASLVTAAGVVLVRNVTTHHQPDHVVMRHLLTRQTAGVGAVA